jgi:hypothetical protein
MKSVITIGIAVLLMKLSTAQAPAKFSLKADIPVNEQIANQYQYLFPDFMQGTAVFGKQVPASARFNYNFLLDEMHFLDANNKKMAIANTDELASVVIGTHTFIFMNNGYFEELADGHGEIKLLLKRQTLLNIVGKEAGYGMTSSSGAISNIDYASRSSGKLYQLSISGEYRIILDSSYWISDGQKLLNARSSKSYRKLFKNKGEIDSYLKENSIDLNKEADIRKLLEFCKGFVK